MGRSGLELRNQDKRNHEARLAGLLEARAGSNKVPAHERQEMGFAAPTLFPTAARIRGQTQLVLHLLRPYRSVALRARVLLNRVVVDSPSSSVTAVAERRRRRPGLEPFFDLAVFAVEQRSIDRKQPTWNSLGSCNNTH